MTTAMLHPLARQDDVPEQGVGREAEEIRSLLAEAYRHCLASVSHLAEAFAGELVRDAAGGTEAQREDLGSRSWCAARALTRHDGALETLFLLQERQLPARDEIREELSLAAADYVAIEAALLEASLIHVSRGGIRLTAEGADVATRLSQMVD